MAAVDPTLVPMEFQPAQAVYVSDDENEQEVDQLDSDTEPEAPADPTQPAPAKPPRPKPSGERLPGHTLLSMNRLENMIQQEGATGNLALSKEGLYVLSVATEEFIKRFVQAGHREANVHRRTMVSYNDMAMSVRQYQEFLFLRDMIPSPVTLTDALIMRQKKEQELLDENPAMAPPLSAAPHSAYVSYPNTSRPSPEPEATPTAPKAPRRSRSTNGKEKTNGTASTSKRAKKAAPNPDPASLVQPGLQWAQGSYMDAVPALENSLSTRGDVHMASPAQQPIVNGYPPSYPPPPPRQSVSPPYQQEDASDSGSYPPPSVYPESHSQSITPPFPDQPKADGSAWPAQPQFTGPASGFLRPPNGPFVSGSSNPGRTIYNSQNGPRQT